MSKKPTISFDEMGSLFKEGLTRAVSRPTVHGYTPHDKQLIFHSAPEKGRLYIGGNRSGKTVGGIVEDIWWMRGTHPYRNTPPPPTRGRIITVSYTEGIEMIIKPELAKWIPPSDLKNGSWEDSYNRQLRTLTLTNGSTVELMSYDQKLEKFAGTSRHWTHFDEEPPKSIFNECKMRLIDTAGHWWITMTPVEGMTWVYDDIYLLGLSPGSNIAVIVIDTAENPFISNAEIEDALSGLDATERKARKEGKFVQIGGLVYKNFNPEKHIIDPVLPPVGWTHYASLDHGLNNPTCWLWHAVAPSGAIITYDELYDNERLINDYAKEIHERNSLTDRRTPDIYVGDPAIAQRNAQTGDSVQTAYARAGVPVVLGNNDVRIGVNKINEYLKNGRWIVTGNCGFLIKQLQRVRWKIYEQAKKRHDNNVRDEIHKKDDHAPDSARYFFSMMPDLYIPPVGQGRDGLNPNDIVKELLGATTPQFSGFMIDHNLTQQLQQGQQSTEWHTIDEHLGGFF